MAIKIEKRLDKDLCRLRDESYLQALNCGQRISLQVCGMSMYPAIKNNDNVTIEPIVGQKLNIGDIVMVSNNNLEQRSFLIHRLVKIEARNGRKQYYTKGDNNSGGMEGPLAINQLRGRLISLRRQDLFINLNSRFYRRLQVPTALFSMKARLFLKLINALSSGFAERRVFFLKLNKRFKSQDPLFYNTQELLILLLRKSMDDSLKDKAITLISEGIRWNIFCDMAIKNTNLKKILNSLKVLTAFIDIPDFVIPRLDEVRLRAALAISSYHKGLLNILKAFSDSGISIMPLKGTYLSERLYADISARGPSADIDLLIKEEDKDSSVALLKKLGYDEGEQEEVPAWRWNRMFYHAHYAPLHLLWDITMMVRSKARIEGLWLDARRINVTTQGQEIISYYEWPDETLLVYLCTDLVNSRGYRSLKYFLEIDELIKKSQNNFNWDLCINKAFVYQINNSLFASLSQAKDILGTQIPDYVLARLKPGIFKILLIKFFLARSVIFTSNLRRRFMEGFLSYIFFELLEAKSLSDYLGIAKRVFFPPLASLSATPGMSSQPQAFYGTRRFFKAFKTAGKILIGS